MQIWVLDYDLIVPDMKLDQIVLQNYRGFDDLNLTLYGQKNFIEKSSKIYESKILNRTRFEDFIKFDNKKTKMEGALMRSI